MINKFYIFLILFGLFIFKFQKPYSVYALNCEQQCQSAGWESGWCTDKTWGSEDWNNYSNFVCGGVSGYDYTQCFNRPLIHTYNESPDFTNLGIVCSYNYCHCYNCSTVLSCPLGTCEPGPPSICQCTETQADCDIVNEGCSLYDEPTNNIKYFAVNNGEIPAGSQIASKDYDSDGIKESNPACYGPYTKTNCTTGTKWKEDLTKTCVTYPNCSDIDCAWINAKYNLNLQEKYEGGVIQDFYEECISPPNPDIQDVTVWCSPSFTSCETCTPKCPTGMTTTFNPGSEQWTGGDPSNPGSPYCIKLTTPYVTHPENPNVAYESDPSSKCYLPPDTVSPNYWCPETTATSDSGISNLGEGYGNAIRVCTANPECGSPPVGIIFGDPCRWYSCGPTPEDDECILSVDFSIDKTSFCYDPTDFGNNENNKVEFTDLTKNINMGENLTYYWEYGDTQTSNIDSKNHFHTYKNIDFGGEAKEDITVTLTVTNGECSGEKENIITIYNPDDVESINFSATHQDIPNITNINWPEILNLNATNGFLTYDWNFGDGQLGNGDPVSHLFDNTALSIAQTYPVTVTGESVISHCLVTKKRNVGIPSKPAFNMPSNNQLLTVGTTVFSGYVDMNNTGLSGSTNNDRVIMFYGEDGVLNGSTKECTVNPPIPPNVSSTFECIYPGGNEINKDYFVRVRAYNGLGSKLGDETHFIFGVPAWFQVGFGAIHANSMSSGKNIQSEIPLDAANPFLFQDRGLATMGSGDIDLGTEHPDHYSAAGLTNFMSAKSGQYKGVIADYTYFREKLDGYFETTAYTFGLQVNNVSRTDPNKAIFASQTAIDNVDTVPVTYLGIPEQTTEINKNTIIIHRGTVRINGNIEVADEVAFMVIASENIDIRPQVNQLEGIYIAGIKNQNTGVITLESGNPGDEQFNFEGSLIAWNNISMKRKMTNNNLPAEIFTFRPDITMALRENFEEIKDFDFTWKEVKP